MEITSQRYSLPVADGWALVQVMYAFTMSTELKKADATFFILHSTNAVGASNVESVPYHDVIREIPCVVHEIKQNLNSNVVMVYSEIILRKKKN